MKTDSQHNRTPLSFVRGATWAMVTFVLIALISLRDRGGFGSADLPVFALCSLPLALAGGAIGYFLYTHPIWQRAWAMYAIGGVPGLVLGLGWTILSILSLGAWAGASSVPVLVCWPWGSAVGLIAALSREPFRLSWRAAIEGFFFITIAMLAAPITVSLYHWKTDAQRLIIIRAKWEPGSQPLKIEGADGPVEKYFGQEEHKILEEAGIGGRLRLLGYGAYGRGEQATAIFLFHSPLRSKVVVPQPKGAVALFVQNETGFSIYPENVPSHSRKIELYQAPHDSNQTVYTVEVTSGKQGSVAVNWSKKAKLR
jgi:hypothetical protein